MVYAKPPFDAPEHVLKYLARYTHRIAISNHRLLTADDQTVTFRYKDYRSCRARSLSLPLVEFCRRFLLHVLPKGFVRIRYYGFLAHAARTRLLARCRLALGQASSHAQGPQGPQGPAQPDETTESSLDLLPQRTRLCAQCGRDSLRCIEVLARPPPSLPHRWPHGAV